MKDQNLINRENMKLRLETAELQNEGTFTATATLDVVRGPTLESTAGADSRRVAIGKALSGITRKLIGPQYCPDTEGLKDGVINVLALYREGNPAPAYDSAGETLEELQLAIETLEQYPEALFAFDQRLKTLAAERKARSQAVAEQIAAATPLAPGPVTAGLNKTELGGEIDEAIQDKALAAIRAGNPPMSPDLEAKISAISEAENELDALYAAVVANERTHDEALAALGEICTRCGPEHVQYLDEYFSSKFSTPAKETSA